MAKRSYRVVYGETMPAWERIFATRRDAAAFAAHCLSVGDMVFSVTPVVPGEAPRSLTAALDAARTPSEAA